MITIKFIGLMSLVVLGLLIVFFFTMFLLGLSKKQRYEQDMIFLESCLHNWIITKRNFDYLMKEFNAVYRNNQDENRTEIAWNLFVEKYKKFFPELVDNKEKVLVS